MRYLRRYLNMLSSVFLTMMITMIPLAVQMLSWPSPVSALPLLMPRMNTLAPHATVNQPIIFVHGLHQNAHNMGKREFIPIYTALQVFSPLQTFYYVDDRAYADGTDSSTACPPRYAPCNSESSVLDNAIRLAGMITQLSQQTQQKVTLIGYSMGAAIIRTVLAGCQQNMTCQANLGPKIAVLVNNVFFIDGVQQGSWMARVIQSTSVTAAVSLLQKIKLPITKALQGFNLKGAAEKDLAPRSINVVSHNSMIPPNHIRYFNFYGNISLSLNSNLLIWPIKVANVDIGDGALLPGTDNPQDTPFWGGARFCEGCNGQNVSSIDANTSYRQWPLTATKSLTLEDLLTCSPTSALQHGCLLGSLYDIVANTPQFHTNMPSSSALDGTDIQVQDTTGISTSKMTGIAQEIALQLQVMPSTQTSCPAPGTARPSVTAPLILGSHSNVVYIVNEFQGNTPTLGTLKRYDVVSGKKTEIIKLPQTSISSALLSADGVWLLFIAQRSGQSILQMIRVDGQGLQTLYCSTSADGIRNLSWSPDRKYVLFSGNLAANTGLGNGNPVYMLDTSSGTLQEEVVPQANNYSGTYPSKWLDATHVYILSFPPNTADTTPNIYLLNIGDGPQQHVENLHAVIIADGGALPPYLDTGSVFDISPDGTRLYLTNCTCGPQSFSGPSSITLRPSSGGTPQTITAASMAVTSLRAISNTSLLLLVSNYGGTTDTTQNGLWKINADGTGLTHLMVNPIGYLPAFAETSYPWSVLSRDGSMYALQSSYSSTTYTLLLGSMNGGPPTTFASISDGTQLFLLGWTTMS